LEAAPLVFPPPLHGRVDRAAPSDWEGIELANRRKSNCQGLWIKIFRTRIGSRAPPLHAESRTPDGFDGVGGPADFDLCRALTTEQIEQQLARKSGDANRGFASPGSYRVGRPSPVKLEPCAA
jgi:hypothetical protein